MSPGSTVVRRARIEGDTARLESVLQDAYQAVLGAMHGRPVTIRLLDLPFDEPTDALADRPDGDIGPVEASAERDLAFGARGVRLSVTEPELLAAPVRALVAAVRARHDGGLVDQVRVMVPFVSTAAEVALVREQIGSIGSTGAADIAVGAMVETPRAALVAGELAEVADFLSIGTNDLTQLTFGLGRDDGARLIDDYVTRGLLPADPFATIDRAGVGDLVQMAVERARDVDPAIEISVCGEHGGDPDSIGFFRSIGVDIVSCSPFRVPIARLAAARAVLGLTP